MMYDLFGERLFDDLMDDLCKVADSFDVPMACYQQPMRTDIREFDKSFEYDIDLPGYDIKDIDAELKDGYLIIKANKDENTEEKKEDGKYIRRERRLGEIQRSFYVGENLQETDIKAHFENGILKISVPKMEAPIDQKRRIAIEG